MAMNNLQLLGAFLFGHDLHDVPDVSRLHHWQLGLGMLLAPEVIKLLKDEEEDE
jgi:hypothetical protein